MMNMSTADLRSHNHQFDKHPSSIMVKTEDDVYFYDNKSETSSRGGNGKTKVFQCTGYGDCSMVFTRSEHLARHMRKHTGEKPFKCVVPGCDRMFSRFDNMMQHTQTHNKVRNGPRRTKPKSKRGGRKSNGVSRRANSSDEYSSLPSPPPSRRGSSNNIVKEHQIILPDPKYVEKDEDDDDMMSDEAETHLPCQQSLLQLKAYYPHPYQPHSYQSSGQPESGRYPDSPVSSESSMNLVEYFPTPSRRRSAPHVRYQPYPYQCSDNQLRKHREIMPSLPRRNSALSQLATYLVDHPDQSPESYLDSHHPTSRLPTRRLSIQDLSNPIERLDESSSNSDSSSGPVIPSQPETSEDGIDLTEDEFQAIQGFGQFYKKAATCNK